MRITTDTTLFYLIDVQERLTPHIDQHERIVQRISRLIAGMRILDIPLLVSEQYKKGLGNTVVDLQKDLSDAPHFEKVTFSGCDDKPTMAFLQQKKRRNIILCGIETHVCVMQTALDLLAADFQPIIVCDAVGSRFRDDHEIALRRLQHAGAILTTSESLLFELCRSANTPFFKAISALVK
ncbi:MAG: hydrolase [Gammaproteobacteria bacterium]|nr:MAG: hydrolase [Gammaproteobacteria bacterium]